jgi:predicted DNA-binding ribbon-helix-helix protein
MLRTQIQIEKDVLARLRQEAARRNCSVSALVRESIEHALQKTDLNSDIAPLRELCGKYRSGTGDLAINHDAYLENGW